MPLADWQKHGTDILQNVMNEYCGVEILSSVWNSPTFIPSSWTDRIFLSVILFLRFESIARYEAVWTPISDFLFASSEWYETAF